LDEFCAICGYHRKHAIRLLSAKNKGRRRKPGRPSQYGEAELKVLEAIWLSAGRLCSKRLHAAIGNWLPCYELAHGRLPKDVRTRLLEMSPRTLDRLMRPVRKRLGSHGKCGTKPGNLLRHQIPIKTEHLDVTKPGVMEADTVAHCWVSLEGNFMWSLTLTDIFSTWTENRAVWNKGYEGVKQAIANIEAGLPFKITGFHSDNGGEFLNHHLIRFLQQRDQPVAMSRGRPYHKDDTAHVEQKNNTHVRGLLGYQRIEDPALLEPINDLYRNWDLYNNLWIPSMKLVEKVKVGSRYIKRYDEPKTPYLRLMESPDVSEAVKTHLTALMVSTNPFQLNERIQNMRDRILSKCR
jgi:transposase InsO family protein